MSKQAVCLSARITPALPLNVDGTQTHRAQVMMDEPKPQVPPRWDFRAALVSHLPHLRAVARSLTGHRDRADDLVNDTVLKALSAESQFQIGTNLKAWLMTILRNHYINGLRRSRIEVETTGELPDSALPTAPNQEYVVEMNEVGLALQRMSVEHREILVLVSAAGLSYDEAAQVCGCAVGTIKSRLNRARGELKHTLSKSKGLAGEGARLDAMPPMPSQMGPRKFTRAMG